MKACGRYFLIVILSVFLHSSTIAAAEAAEEGEPTKLKRVSIDALVVKYHAASEKDAYKIMNQIKQEIARMSRERQANAIGKIRQASDKKADLSKKKKRHKKQKKIHDAKVCKQHKQHLKRAKATHQKKKNKALDMLSEKQHDTKHPDPLSTISSRSGHTAMSGMGGF